MSSRRQLLIWILAGAVIVLVIAGVVWRRRSTAQQWNTFLVGDPRAGADIFQKKGCGQCHAILGSGPTVGPDLGLRGRAGSTMADLATQMWNHAPRMWDQLRLSRVAYPEFSAEEMSDLFAYLYVTCYDDESGNADHGQVLFAQKGCIRCHAVGDTGGTIGPRLRDIGPVDTPLFWSQAMWNHAPQMEAHMRDLKISWPRFEGEEMNDVLAFVRQERGGTEQEASLLPANPRRGWSLFRRKGCISCHAIRGEGGTVGPDLGAGSPLPRTLTQMTARMWNHSPEMWTAMKDKGIERPTFAGQEMADLIAFLYTVRYFDMGGSPTIGETLFSERKCAQCHGADALGGKIGPRLRNRNRFLTPMTFALSLWSHGPQMYTKAQELGLGWPNLSEGDLSHLLAFLNSTPAAGRDEGLRP